MRALQRLDRQLRSAGVPIFGVRSGVSKAPEIEFRPEATVPERTEAQVLLAAFDWSEEGDRKGDARMAKAGATATLQQVSVRPEEQRSLLLYALAQVVLDQFNQQADAFNALRSAAQSATSLADLRSRAAAIADLPKRTLAQLRTAIVNKIDGANE